MLQVCAPKALEMTQPPEDAVITSLDSFLAQTERRALIMAEVAVGDREEALDLIQDSMLAFVRSYAHKPPEQWPPLFYRVVQNRIRDWYRRSAVRNRWRTWLRIDDDGADPIQNLPDPQSSVPDQELEQNDNRQAIIEALHELPLRQQQAFLLRIWEGMDVADTARAMSCSQGTVKTHLSRAMHSLREQLEYLR